MLIIISIKRRIIEHETKIKNLEKKLNKITKDLAELIVLFNSWQKIAVHNCNDNIVGECPNYYCGICGKPL